LVLLFLLTTWNCFLRDLSSQYQAVQLRGGTSWHRVISWWMALHRWKWKDVRRRFTDRNGRWQKLSADGIELFDLQAVTVTRYRYRGNTIPTPWPRLNHA
ncbi:hypothetical protein ACFYVG_37195, partial [Streptomyces spiralis]